MLSSQSCEKKVAVNEPRCVAVRERDRGEDLTTRTEKFLSEIVFRHDFFFEGKKLGERSSHPHPRFALSVS